MSEKKFSVIGLELVRDEKQSPASCGISRPTRELSVAEGRGRSAAWEVECAGGNREWRDALI